MGEGKGLWHRWQGRIYVLAMAISIPNAFICVGLTQNGDWQRYGLLMLAIYWTVTLFWAVYFVKMEKGKKRLHKEFMMRNYAGTFAFVTFRIGLGIGGSSESPVPTITLLINFAVIEAKIQYDRWKERKAEEEKKIEMGNKKLSEE